MDNPFEAIKREYVNRYSETHGILFAENYDQFVDKMLRSIMTALNEDYYIRQLIDKEMVAAIADGKSPAEWSDMKARLLKIIFFLVLDECPELKHEFAVHLYNELRKENRT